MSSGIMAETIRRFLDSNGDRCPIGDLGELREAVDRVKAYQDFQPDKFDRRELNLRLRALIQDRECGDDLQDSSCYRWRRWSRRDARDRLPGEDRFEAGDARPDLGRRHK